VGGTGKTPQIEYLIRLLSDKKIAILSRGYRRKTRGFVIANSKSTSIEIGDEPFQYFQKYKEIIVAVDEKRVNGIQQLLNLLNPPEIILLDDAFQHRSVKPGLSILLTPFDDLYIDDFVLPAGNLREFQSGYKRADIIIITRSPENISDEVQFKINNRLKLFSHQQLYFSGISYNEILKGGKEKLYVSELEKYEVLLITGIANPKPLLAFLEKREINFKHMQFGDHHLFSEQDIVKIKGKFNKITSEKKIILTTEKDYVRIFASLENCYFLSIETIILKNEADFSRKILNYVG
jgi:tetraacyldisaccharide 4'-kinase